MPASLKVTAALVLIIAAYAYGRYASPVKVETVVKTVTVVKEVDKTASNKKDHKVVVITQTPDGTKTTTITDDSTSTKTTEADKQTDMNKSETTETTFSSSKVTISALGGLKPFEPISAPVYGGSITKPILGPITVGIWGLSNVTVGASVGLTF